MNGDDTINEKKLKSEGSSDGIQLRKGKKSETIRILFRYQEQLCRETLKRDHTKANIAYAVRRRGEIINAIDRGDFDYDVFFPNSVRAKKTAAAAAMAAARETSQVVTVGQLLREYLLVAKRNLELSSYNCYQQVARTHLFPKWDNKPVYMDASRLPGIFGCAVRQARLQFYTWPRPFCKDDFFSGVKGAGLHIYIRPVHGTFAWPQWISLGNSFIYPRLREPENCTGLLPTVRPFCHHTQYLAQPFNVPFLSIKRMSLLSLQRLISA